MISPQVFNMPKRNQRPTTLDINASRAAAIRAVKGLRDAGRNPVEVIVPVPTKTKQQRRPRRRASGMLTIGTTTGVGQPTVFQPKSSNSVVIERTARVAEVDNITGSPLERGHKILDMLVEPDMTPDFAALGSRFQFTNYLALQISVITSFPATTSGSYMVSFLQDPAEEVACGAQALSDLTSVEGTRVVNAFESTIIKVPVSNTCAYYNAHREGADIRLHSPGRIVVLVDGPINQQGTFTVNMTYKIRLSRPVTAQAETVVEPPIRITRPIISGDHGIFHQTDGTYYLGAMIGAEPTVDAADFLDIPPAYIEKATNDVGTQLSFEFDAPTPHLAAVTALRAGGANTVGVNVYIDRLRLAYVLVEANKRVWRLYLATSHHLANEGHLAYSFGYGYRTEGDDAAFGVTPFAPGEKLVPTAASEDCVSNAKAGFLGSAKSSGSQTINMMPSSDSLVQSLADSLASKLWPRKQTNEQTPLTN